MSNSNLDPLSSPPSISANFDKDTPFVDTDDDEFEEMGIEVEQSDIVGKDKEAGDLGMVEMMEAFDAVAGIEGPAPTIDLSVDDDAVNCDAGGDASKNRSEAWAHMIPVTLDNGVQKNKCKHCGKLMSVQKRKTTSHLMRHLTDHCPFRSKNFPKPLHIEKGETSKKSVQSQLSMQSEGQSSIHTFVFNFGLVITKAAHMILAHEYPFSIVEHKVFNEFLKAYTPYYQKISRYTVRKECFLVFETEREKIRVLLSKVNRVSLTTDCWWSGVQKIGYMVVTCHFTDRNGSLQKRVLSFVNVPPPHNGLALAKEVHRVCNIYGISDKVASVTVDNASANDVCIAILKKDHNKHHNLVLDGKLFHVRCCAHIINLLVRDGLKEIESIVEVVREGVKYLFGSENRLSSFNEHRINLKLPATKLVLDNNTRWNSTYVMLSTAYTFKDCFSKYGEDDELFERFVPNAAEWAQVFEVCEFLEVFLDVTNLISGSNYPTVNLFLLELCRIKELINAQLEVCSSKHMQRMAQRMAEKYDKYWSECDFLLSFGSILDPRYKKGMVQFSYPMMYPTDHHEKEEKVFKCFSDLFDEYVKIYGDPKGKGPPPEYSAYLKQPPSSVVGTRKYDEFKKNQRVGKSKSDLELYYEAECLEHERLDVLGWWRLMETKYKILSIMARDILSIPITTVASESTFSAGGRVIDKKRASMRRDTIEVLLCGGDWIKEMYGVRSLKENTNDDPIELEFENEYHMKDTTETSNSVLIYEYDCCLFVACCFFIQPVVVALLPCYLVALSPCCLIQHVVVALLPCCLVA